MTTFSFASTFMNLPENAALKQAIDNDDLKAFEPFKTSTDDAKKINDYVVEKKAYKIAAKGSLGMIQTNSFFPTDEENFKTIGITTRDGQTPGNTEYNLLLLKNHRGNVTDLLPSGETVYTTYRKYHKASVLIEKLKRFGYFFNQKNVEGVSDLEKITNAAEFIAYIKAGGNLTDEIRNKILKGPENEVKEMLTLFGKPDAVVETVVAAVVAPAAAPAAAPAPVAAEVIPVPEAGKDALTMVFDKVVEKMIKMKDTLSDSEKKAVRAKLADYLFHFI